MSAFGTFQKLFDLVGGVRATKNPVTGGVIFNGATSTLKLPPGETDLTNAASAATFTEPMAAMATALINTQSIIVAHHAFA